MNGGTLIEQVNQGQIDPTNDVILNGSSVVTLVGNNTLNSLTFNNNSGIAAPTVSLRRAPSR